MSGVLRAAALDYAHRGWKVFPLAVRDKVPLLKGNWQNHATSGAAQIETWWTREPMANIAVFPGPSGLVVLDLDGATAETHARALGALPSPTLQCRTARGRHLYFLKPDFAVSNRALADKLDVRGDAGYVVAPPSVHPSGARYEWQDARAPILPLPARVLAALRDEGQTSEANAQTTDVIAAGGRNSTLTSLAGTMRRRGMSEEAMLAALLAENVARCDPPLSEREVRAIAASIGKKPSAASLPASARREDFVAFLPEPNSYLYTLTGASFTAANVNKCVSPQPGEKRGASIPASKWLDRHRRAMARVWAPGQPQLIEGRVPRPEGGWVETEGAATFNVYRAPRALVGGDDKGAQPWLDHVARLFPEEAGHLARWFASRVQRPDVKVNHGIVLYGAQGIGKDALVAAVTPAIGAWNAAEIAPDHLFGDFNGFIKSVILRVNEGRELGDHDRYRFYEKLKVLTASPPDVLLCNEKYRQPYAVANVCGVVLTTNHRDGLWLPPDDRRFFVAGSELTKAELPADYFARLFRWYEHEGGYAHVAAYLAALDLSSFDPKAPPPHTTAWHAMVAAGRAPEDEEMHNALERVRAQRVTRGTLTDGAPLDAVTIAELANASEGFEVPGDFYEWLKDRRNRRALPHRLEACGFVPVRNPTAAAGRWKVGGADTVVYARREQSMRERLVAAQSLADRAREARDPRANGASRESL